MLKTKRKTTPARSRSSKSLQEVLTLAETATYLRLPEAEVVRLWKSRTFQGIGLATTGDFSLWACLAHRKPSRLRFERCHKHVCSLGFWWGQTLEN